MDKEKEKKNNVNNMPNYENNKAIRIMVGFMSITISLAMIGYTVGTLFNLNRKRMVNTKNETKVEQMKDSIEEKELIKTR